jgi:hypothetical protein
MINRNRKSANFLVVPLHKSANLQEKKAVQIRIGLPLNIFFWSAKPNQSKISFLHPIRLDEHGLVQRHCCPLMIKFNKDDRNPYFLPDSTVYTYWVGWEVCGSGEVRGEGGEVGEGGGGGWRGGKPKVRPQSIDFLATEAYPQKRHGLTRAPAWLDCYDFIDKTIQHCWGLQ